MELLNSLNCWRFGGESFWGRGSYAGINNIDCHEGIGHADYGIATMSDAILLKTASTESGYFLYSLLWSTIPYDFFGIGYISLYNLLYVADASLATNNSDAIMSHNDHSYIQWEYQLYSVGIDTTIYQYGINTLWTYGHLNAVGYSATIIL